MKSMVRFACARRKKGFKRVSVLSVRELKVSFRVFSIRLKAWPVERAGWALNGAVQDTSVFAKSWGMRLCSWLIFGADAGCRQPRLLPLIGGVIINRQGCFLKPVNLGYCIFQVKIAFNAVKPVQVKKGETRKI